MINTPLADQLEEARQKLNQARTPAYGGALALIKKLEENVDKFYCGQCGQYIWKPSCGPTHAAYFAELDKDTDEA